MAAATTTRGPAMTPFGAVAAVARRAACTGAIVRWPSPKWRTDPVAFADEVFGIDLWRAQVEILESIRDNRNTTVRSGHKCGKTTALAVAALWFYASFDRARVIMTAVKASQVDEVMWKEVRRLYRLASKRIPIDGTLHEVARSGLRAPDDRQIWGITARDSEGLAGISGPNILVLADEASGIADRFFEVLGSSLAGDGGVVRKCYISNPTKTTGEFYRSHTSNAQLYHRIHISSEETPNARGEKTIPGLAGREWIAEKRAEYGEDSPQYRVRVRGEFVHDLQGKIVSLNDIKAAQERWDETPVDGDLQIGVDPAGDGVLGDETAIAVRRGRKIVTVLAWRGQSEDAIVEHILGALATYRTRDVVGTPRIVLDVEGGIGTRVFSKLRTECERRMVRAHLVAVRGGKKFWGSPEYHLVRDGLWGQAQKWIRAGGAIPEDTKLEQELNAPIFIEDTDKRFRATDKKILRQELGRSPDRADATCLAIWGFASVSLEDDDAPAADARPSTALDPYDDEPDRAPDRVFDPYGGAG